MYNFHVKTRQKIHEGGRRYCPCEIKKLTNYIWGQNAQSTLGISQDRHLLRKEDHQYAPHLKIKPHPKNAWQSFDNPLTHSKCVSHMQLKCNLKEFLCLKKSWMDSLHFDTLAINPTRVNWVERWSKAWVISLIGPMMWVLFIKEIKMQLRAYVRDGLLKNSIMGQYK